ncbi:MAG: LysR family transcriptional regulator [Bdellovibrionaceae bacterium]|nr:LysR family transcriptional regulator [Pseudobdellovibrionaceae bacterium]
MTAAADKLYLTQPAVSQQIRNLEDELGVELLERGVRRVKATLQGQLLYDYAKRILNLTQQAEVAIQTMSQEVAGQVTLGTKNSFGLFLLSPIVGLFLKYNPRLRIELIYGTGEMILEKMKNSEVDMAILPDIRSEYELELPHFEGKFLLKEEMLLVGSGRDTSMPKIIHAKGLEAKPIVHYTEPSPRFEKMLRQQIEENGVRYEPVFAADNVGTLKRVVESGLGWGFLPSFSIKKQLRSGRLASVEVEDLKYSSNVNLYARKTDEIQRMSEVFYRALYQQSISGTGG